MKVLKYIFRSALITLMSSLYANIPIYAQSNPCDSVPPEYKEICNQANAWLDQRLIDWKITKWNPMNFGVYHVFASDDMFVKTNSYTDINFLKVIEEVIPNIVVLYIRPGVYSSQKQRYDSLITQVRQDGKKLFIGARPDDGILTFLQYENFLTNYTKNIIGKIKPDFFGIVIEPATMEKGHKFMATDLEWAMLVDTISNLSKIVSPNTKTVADGHTGELNFLKLVSNVQNLDIVGFNIYGNPGIYPEYSGYLGSGDVVGRAIDTVSIKGKETWILETWTSAMVSQFEKVMGTQPFMKPIDAKWMRVIYYYAQRHNMNCIVPFFTGKFICYGIDSTEFINAFNNKQRTPPFYTYKDLINEFNLNSNIEESGSNSLERFELHQNYPNPFNSTTQIIFSIPKREHVILTVFDVFGREVATLVNETFDPGDHLIKFAANDLTNGFYMYTLTAEKNIQQKVMLVLK